MTTHRIWGGARVVSEDPLTVELQGTPHTHLQLDRAVTVSGLVRQGAPLTGAKLTLVLNGATSAAVETRPRPGLVPVTGNTKWLRVEIGTDDAVSLSPSSGMFPLSASALEGASTIDVYADDDPDPHPVKPL